MNCPKCGRIVTPNTSFCPVCGTPLNPGAAVPPPPMQPSMQQPIQQPMQINTWLVPAILATIFCCLPFGIVSIVYASRANSAVGCGNYQLAQENANKAKTWFWWAFGVGIASSVFWIMAQIILAAAAAAD